MLKSPTRWSARSNLEDSTVNGEGRIDVEVVNEGDLDPGNSPGLFTINNDSVQEPSGRLLIEIGGLLVCPSTLQRHLRKPGHLRPV